MKLTAVLNDRSSETADLLCRIEGQKSLQPHQRVNDEQATEMKDQHADGVRHRMLLVALVDAGNLVDRKLHRPQDRRKEGALAAEHARQVGAEHGVIATMIAQ